ncbi:MAG: hypothetical protein HC778_00735 [Chamaesiphon sp. CSU_1_12]|nr:hypothetical protein [Chamaesiphon sp. CSU_1_12]
MLKIWLTWLQPSVGVLGTALVLSSPLCSYAATKPATVRNITKVSTQVSPWSNLKANGTRIDRELLSGVAPTPDLAVRQLAVNSIGSKGLPSFANTSTTADISGVANFVAPSVNWQKRSAKAIKPIKSKQVKKFDLHSTGAGDKSASCEYSSSRTVHSEKSRSDTKTDRSSS